MKAILVNDDRSLSWSDVPNPEIKSEEVLVEIQAAALNRADLLQRAGDYPPPPGCPEWMGLEVAGVITEMGDEAKAKAFELLKRVRECGLTAETDVVGRGLRAQMKYADKIGARYSMVLGDNEIAENKAKVKNMESGEQTELALDESFAEKFSVLQLADSSSFEI